jgi:hypothetical protein
MMNLIGWIRLVWQQPLTPAILAAAASYCFYGKPKLGSRLGRMSFLGLRFFFIIALLIFSFTLVERFANQEVFDFTAFYLYGKAAVLGHNIYDSEQLQTVFSNLTDLPPLNYIEFREEIVNTGAMYPPFSLLLYGPFGTLSYVVAEKSWMLFTWLFIPLCIHQIRRIWFREAGAEGLMLVATLVMLLGASRQTAHFLQTNFITLYLLLLMKRFEDRPLAGFFLALGMLVKPYMALLGLVFIFRKQWITMAVAAITAAAYSLITLAIWGKGLFVSYLFDNPSKRLPDWVFKEPINQSLNGVLLRWKIISPGSNQTYTILVFMILLLTFFMLYWLGRRKMGSWHWTFVLLTALLIYPGTLSYYGVVLLFVLFFMFVDTPLSNASGLFKAVIAGALFWLATVSLFAAILILLSLALFLCLSPTAVSGKIFLNREQ